MPGTPIHEERQHMFLRPLLILAMVALLAVAAWQVREDTGSMLSILIFLPVCVLLVWGFTELKVVVTATELRFGFPLYRRRAHLSHVKVGDIEPIPFLAGIGIHQWRGRWVYNAKLGRGVRVTIGRTEYLVGSDQPERLQNALLMVARGKGLA